MSATKNLLVELLVEELPPKALKSLGESFAATLAENLKSQGLASEASVMTAFASPRRLAVHISQITAKAADKAVQQKLMPVAVGLDASGNATAALLKKLATLNADANAVPNLKRKPDGKSETLFLDVIVPGVSLAEGLQKALAATIDMLPIPKVMSYQLADGWSSVNFVRPAHALVALYGTDIVPISALGLQAGRATHGHRFEAAKAPIELRAADNYAEQLEIEGAVIANFAARRAEVVRQLAAAAAKEGLKPIDDDALLDEVTALVERPNVLVCRFEEQFLEVPPECLILTMKANQKYFPLLDSGGNLTNKFLVVSNIRPGDASAVIGGNERVVRPRLADAKFFYDQDRKTRLETRVPKLGSVVYHGKLGSQLQRVERIQLLAGHIARALNADAMLAERAAWLSKADLLTNMVGEFPELQGVMGRYYARHDGEPAEVAEAIAVHYKPRFAGDTLPEGAIASAVALADKLDTLAGLFGIGQQPTGEKDPFGLRRAALGVIRILVEGNYPLSLTELIRHAFAGYPDAALAHADLEAFIYERFAGYLRERDFTTLEVDAVLSLRPDLLYLAPRQLAAVRAFRSLPEAESLSAANKRVANILKQAEAKGETLAGVDQTKLAESAEQKLFETLRSTSATAAALFQRGDFTGYLKSFAALKLPVDTFFDEVMVMVEDTALRRNRLALLRDLRQAMNQVADISRLAQ